MKRIEADSLEKLKKDFTETEKVILSRRSVRQYKKEQVPEFMVKRILEAGRFAPSAGTFSRGSSLCCAMMKLSRA